jgi:hypothetical protein
MLLSNYIRDVPPGIAREATFIIDIGPGEGFIRDDREPHEKTVAGCEGGSCVIAQRAAPQG